MKRVLSVVGARPNFMKVAPIDRELRARGSADSLILHTGQHYDERMSDVFFRELELPEPDIYLGVGSGTHAEQTGRVMIALERALDGLHPDLVVVVGDVNSTLAGALVAAKCHIPLAHVEAGLRSGDWRMPEEVNRVLTDRMSDLLFVTEESGLRNLASEGIPDDRVHFVGNVMIDSLLHFRRRSLDRDLPREMGLERRAYILVTLHRPSNVDDPGRLEDLVTALVQLASGCPVVFPAHPRTRERLEANGYDRSMGSVRLIEPLGYLEFLGLMEGAGVVVTDSGGIQEETTCLGIPCVTVRDSTERPVTVEVGTNRLCGADPEDLVSTVEAALERDMNGARVPPLWDGRAAGRIVDIIEGFLE